MKKTFPLQVPGRDDARVLEAIKGDVRKYVKRERRKTLPRDFEVWQFACRIGAAAATAEVIALPALAGAIEQVAKSGAASVYVEILASPAHRAPGVPSAPTPSRPVG